jgi:hypothetical protein
LEEEESLTNDTNSTNDTKEENISQRLAESAREVVRHQVPEAVVREEEALTKHTKNTKERA